jgi:hypothetical protein
MLIPIPNQENAETPDKAMDALLLAHNAILDKWFAHWAAEHQARVDTAFDRQDYRFGVTPQR